MIIKIEYVLLILVIVCKANCYCQNTLINNYEGVFDYALIEGSNLYAANKPAILGKSEYIMKKSIISKSIPVIHYSSGSDDNRFPYVWQKNDALLYTAYYMHYKSKAPARVSFRKFEELDTIEVKSLPNTFIKKESFSINPLNNYNWTLITHRRPYLSDSTIETYIHALSFDISIKGNSTIVFYLSDSDALYLWEGNIPTRDYIQTDWKEKIVYASINFKEDFIPRNESDSYTGKNTVSNAIKDTLFFEGHFKVIAQNNEKYIINRKHGYIYHLGNKAIERIGQVKLTEEYPKIQGKPLFIEDRDNNRLIFFAPVEWEDINLPKPNVYYMKEKEMREYFKYVLD